MMLIMPLILPDMPPLMLLILMFADADTPPLSCFRRGFHFFAFLHYAVIDAIDAHLITH